VYMICRNAERANRAKDQIVAEIAATPSGTGVLEGELSRKLAANAQNKLHVIIADCSLQSDISRAYNQILAHMSSVFDYQDGASTPEASFKPRLDGIVCNAGAMFNEQTFTTENIESTFALHLLQGTFFLVRCAMSLLEQTANSRVVVVSSAGMYNVNLPSWYISSSEHVRAASAPNAGYKYDGQLQYAYAKRGQVLLCEHWAATSKGVKFVSCHPGWTQTEAVDAGKLCFSMVKFYNVLVLQLMGRVRDTLNHYVHHGKVRRV
jgi:NAD(P)-dependent dehydrogenase (short-subunit alcohol dehydrogenase family)